MTGLKNLYDLANGIYAAGRIGEVINSTHRSQKRGVDNVNAVSAFSQILDILAEYTPEKQRTILGAVANKSRTYFDVYKNLDQNFNTYKNRRVDGNEIINTLAILQPVLGSKERTIIDKIIKLNEVFG